MPFLKQQISLHPREQIVTTRMSYKEHFPTCSAYLDDGLHRIDVVEVACTSWAFSFIACLTDESCPGTLLQSHVLENQEERQRVTRHDVSASSHS